MLRLLVLALVLANAGYFAWSQGLLADYGYAPTEQAEPQRLNRQIHPEALQLLNSKAPAPAVLAAAPPSVPASGQCLQAGLFNDAQASALRTRLATSLPDGSWTLESGVEPGGAVAANGFTLPEGGPLGMMSGRTSRFAPSIAGSGATGGTASDNRALALLPLPALCA